ncbi:MAG: glycine cleavage system aminomethyltransferase GcvT [Pseudonocardiaceae bacterium]|nr:glycine cleavage system aminomethyltransferase GcvT [Pseudonocardiaceae bacterium]
MQRSPLHDAHAELDAKFAEFGGWEMPIQYGGRGVVAEHTSVRESVGVFDVSHLGKLVVSGPGAAAFLNTCFTNDLNRIAPGKAQYTLCCTDDGGTVDDLIVYLVGADEVFCMPNAANTAEVYRMVSEAAPDGIDVREAHTEYGVLAVQGPRSAEVLSSLDLPTPEEYMSYVDAEWRGHTVRVCRTGYTGEHGYELVPAAEDAPQLWSALLDVVGPLGGGPCGLGARDTLRTEMGYPLHGHELSTDITPVQGVSSWAVGWDKERFWGRDVLVAERAAKPRRRVRCLRGLERGVPRPGMPVLDKDGIQIGETTSGTFSPTLKIGIALALIDTAAGVSAGDEVVVDVRGRSLRCEVIKPPFVQSGVR